MIELLQAMGLDDISAALWGFLAGATMSALWVSAWFVGESVVNWLLEPGFTAHTDDALELTREQEVAS
ncbi:hypothetical protein [Nocardioides lacusdianchii]|uniref:hypothetical protein n=1 Tax=Nocardioides lacusdianchii TaxID=2783664 RepID=UPI001CCAB5FB|nr:hypothetical protein [Nocardioides lacusdianchii]